jgi:serine/threonine-protein kinase RsbW
VATEAFSSISIPVDLSYIAPVTAYLGELAKKIGFGAEEGSQICLALEESLSNVVRFGYEEDTEDHIEIIAEHDAMGLVIRILEKGIPFSQERLPDYQPDRPELDETGAGLGLYLIKSFVDEFTLIRKGSQGQEIRLVNRLKKRPPDHAEPSPPDNNFDQTAAQAADIANSTGYLIREIRRDEVVEVSKCAYKCYGYTYEDYIYYPEQLAEMNRQGLLYSLVAVTGDNKIMGHTALKFAYAGASIAESGVAFVLPEYRKLGLFAEFNGRFIEHAASSGLNGLYGRAVTSHTASQRMAAGHGYKDCGLFLAVFPNNLNFKKMVGQTAQRESGVLSFLALNSQEARTIYPPDSHRHMVGRLFDSLGLPVHLGSESPWGSDSQGQPFGLKTVTNQSLNMTEIGLPQYGEGLEDEFRGQVKMLRLSHFDVLHAVINLEDPGAARMVDLAEELGFIFAGILPFGLNDHHALIMQYLNNVEIDLGRIKLITPEAESMLEFIGSRL